jgi:hypothetical protein
LIAESPSTTKIHQAVAGAAPVDLFRNEIAGGEFIVQLNRSNRKMGRSDESGQMFGCKRYQIDHVCPNLQLWTRSQ